MRQSFDTLCMLSRQTRLAYGCGCGYSEPPGMSADAQALRNAHRPIPQETNVVVVEARDTGEHSEQQHARPRTGG